VTITAWRIFKPKHAKSAFTGEGARLYGGRWNSKGTPVIYTAGSLALAALEMLVHLQAPQVLEAYLAAPVTFDEKLVSDLQQASLPRDLFKTPAPWVLQYLGNTWVREQQSAVLRVPSAVIHSEYNYLLNPAHRDFGKIARGKPRRFRFDPRLAR
jgi:RES domain-containing protein